MWLITLGTEPAIQYPHGENALDACRAFMAENFPNHDRKLVAEKRISVRAAEATMGDIRVRVDLNRDMLAWAA